MSGAAPDRWATIPNLLSLLRLLLVPVILAQTWAGNLRACFWLLLAAFATDLMDGFLARRLNQMTSLGATLDSVADAALFIAVVAGGWRLFWDLLRPFAWLIGIALLLGTGAQVISLVRYRRPASFHTYLAKATGGAAVLALISLFWAGATTGLVGLACIMGVLTQAEQVAIALTLREWQTDMPSWWQIRRPSVRSHRSAR